MDDATLIRYLAGECTDAERRAVEQWSDADDANAARLAGLGEMWRLSAPGAPSSDPDVEAAWSSLSARLAPDTAGGGAHPSRSRGWIGWAAAVAAVIGSSVLAAHLHHDHSALTTFETRPGQQGRLTLSDGSSVVLAPGSTLAVRADYGESSRRVELAGEALFDVLDDAGRPFHVDTHRGRVVVLGTEFAVRTFDDEARDQVAVRSGSVRFAGREADPSSAVTVTSGQVARLADMSASPALAADTASAFAWTVGAWAFSESPLSEVVVELSRRWGRSVRVDSAVSNRRVSGSYLSESPEEMLSAISLATGTRVVNQRDTISFLPNDEASR